MIFTSSGVNAQECSQKGQQALWLQKVDIKKGNEACDKFKQLIGQFKPRFPMTILESRFAEHRLSNWKWALQYFNDQLVKRMLFLFQRQRQRKQHTILSKKKNNVIFFYEQKKNNNNVISYYRYIIFHSCVKSSFFIYLIFG